MYYRIVAPPDFFESSHYPAVCILTGCPDGLQPTDLDLSFIRAAEPAGQLHGQPVTDLTSDEVILQSPRGKVRKTSRNLLLTLPMRPGALFRWRLIHRFIPALLLLICPIAAMSTAFAWPELQHLEWVLSFVAAGLVLGLVLAKLYRRMQPPATHFGVTPHGFVSITLPEQLKPAAEQLKAALQIFLTTVDPAPSALSTPAATPKTPVTAP